MLYNWQGLVLTPIYARARAYAIKQQGFIRRKRLPRDEIVRGETMSVPDFFSS